MSTHQRTRVRYVVLALVTIAVGLLVHRDRVALSAGARDILGDALWAMMIVWWIGAMAPAMRLWTRGVGAMSLCALVELSQLIRTPTLDAVRTTTLGGLILGHDFDTRDLWAYAVGVTAAVVLEWCARARRSGDSVSHNNRRSP